MQQLLKRLAASLKVKWLRHKMLQEEQIVVAYSLRNEALPAEELQLLEIEEKKSLYRKDIIRTQSKRVEQENTEKILRASYLRGQYEGLLEQAEAEYQKLLDKEF